MAKVLEATDIDQLDEQVDVAIEEESWRVGSTDGAPDLSDGGMVNGVRVRTARDKAVTEGRPNARRAWMWNGSESLLPLAWDPDGKIHDGAKRYLLKRYCLCCTTGGFRGRRCPKCVKGCTNCKGSTDRKKVIPCFYLRKEDVPFPAKFYGSISCFHQFCERRGEKGFLTQEDMRIHARTRHRMEYQSYMESQAANKADEISELRALVHSLMIDREQTPSKKERTPAQVEAARKLGENSKTRAKTRAAV